MRADFLVGALLLTSCAASHALPPGERGDLALSLSLASGGEASPALAVTMTNRSSADLCVRTELLKNPYTWEMDIRLRDRGGRTMKVREAGFLPSPDVTPVRIRPGASVQAVYPLDSRFRLAGKPLGGMSARASLRYDACDGSQSRQAISAWQRI